MFDSTTYLDSRHHYIIHTVTVFAYIIHLITIQQNKDSEN